MARPGGLFRGADSLSSPLFRLLHIGDTMVVLDPATLPKRLDAAGFTDVRTSVSAGSVTFLARTTPGRSH